MRLTLTLMLIIAVCCSSYAQNAKEPATPSFTYAYITVEGKGFSKKLNVNVDLGDTPEQIKAGKEYSDILTNKKSYAAVINYMAENQFELVETRDNIMSYQGTGGTEGIILIMRKPK